MIVADEWLSDLPQQFNGKKNIEVFIRAFSKPVQLTTSSTSSMIAAQMESIMVFDRRAIFAMYE